MSVYCKKPDCINIYYMNGYCAKHHNQKNLCIAKRCSFESFKNYRCKNHQDWEPICMVKDCEERIYPGCKVCINHCSNIEEKLNTICKFPKCRRISLRKGIFCKNHSRNLCLYKDCSEFVELKYKKITKYCPMHIHMDNFMNCYIEGCTNMKRGHDISYCHKHEDNINACVKNGCRKEIFKNSACKRHFYEITRYDSTFDDILNNFIIMDYIENMDCKIDDFEIDFKNMEYLDDFKFDPNIFENINH